MTLSHTENITLCYINTTLNVSNNVNTNNGKNNRL